MAKRPWSGDGTYHLPARQVEPYRLWFEYLKLALRDPEIEVNRRFYRSWGKVDQLTFTEWWGPHWRRLFAIDSGVRVVDRDDLPAKNDPSLLVRLPLGKTINETLRDVRDLLQEHGAGVKLKTVPRGKFALSKTSEQGFEKNLNTARCMLRLYGSWLSHSELDRRKRIEAATLAYYDWADRWDTTIRTKGWRRPRPYFPMCFRTYAGYIRDRRAGRRARGGQIGYAGDAENARRQVVRYLKKARTIAANVGRGEFPGDY